MGILAAGGFRWPVRQSAKRSVQAEGAVGGSLEERPGGSGNAVPVQAGDHFATTGLGEIDHGTACCYEELNSVSWQSFDKKHLNTYQCLMFTARR